MKKTLVPAAVAFLLTIGMAKAIDAPEVTEGLWSIQRHTIDNPGNKKTDSTLTICRNHAYDEYTQSLTKNLKGCTLNQSFQGGKYSSKSHCVIGGTVVESEGTATYQGSTSAHSETHATYTPAMGGVSETTTIMDQKYVGNCPAGAQPGDMTSADGRVTHLWKH